MKKHDWGAYEIVETKKVKPGECVMLDHNAHQDLPLRNHKLVFGVNPRTYNDFAAKIARSTFRTEEQILNERDEKFWKEHLKNNKKVMEKILS